VSRPARGLLLLLALAVPATVEGGAWTQDPGRAYVRAYTSFLETRERFDENGDTAPFDNAGGGTRDTQYKELSNIVYAEVGVAEGWNILADLVWKYVEAVQPSAVFKTWGFGDLRTGFKWRLHRSSQTVVSVGSVATVPLGYASTEYPAIGSGVFELGLLGAVGHATAGAWINGEGMFKLRGGDFRHQIEGALAGGFGLGGGFNARGEARGVVPLGATRIVQEGSRFDPATVDPTYLDLAGILSYTVGSSGVALEFEVRGTPVGKNTLKGTKFMLAVATSPALRWRQ
jgi:hypothetical protein